MIPCSVPANEKADTNDFNIAVTRPELERENDWKGGAQALGEQKVFLCMGSEDMSTSLFSFPDGLHQNAKRVAQDRVLVLVSHIPPRTIEVFVTTLRTLALRWVSDKKNPNVSEVRALALNTDIHDVIMFSGPNMAANVSMKVLEIAEAFPDEDLVNSLGMPQVRGTNYNNHAVAQFSIEEMIRVSGPEVGLSSKPHQYSAGGVGLRLQLDNVECDFTASILAVGLNTVLQAGMESKDGPLVPNPSTHADIYIFVIGESAIDDSAIDENEKESFDWWFVAICNGNPYKEVATDKYEDCRLFHSVGGIARITFKLSQKTEIHARLIAIETAVERNHILLSPIIEHLYDNGVFHLPGNAATKIVSILSRPPNNVVYDVPEVPTNFPTKTYHARREAGSGITFPVLLPSITSGAKELARKRKEEKEKEKEEKRKENEGGGNRPKRLCNQVV